MNANEKAARELAEKYVEMRLSDEKDLMTSVRSRWHDIDADYQMVLSRAMATGGLIVVGFIEWAVSKNPTISAGSLLLAIPTVLEKAIHSMTDSH